MTKEQTQTEGRAEGENERREEPTEGTRMDERDGNVEVMRRGMVVFHPFLLGIPPWMWGYVGGYTVNCTFIF